MKKSYLFTTLLSLFVLTNITANFKWSHTQRDDDTIAISIDYNLKDDALFKDTLRFSLAHPEVQIESWDSTQPAQKIYDPSFKADKLSYTGSGTLHVIVKKTSNMTTEPTNFYMHYRLKNGTEPEEAIYQINFDQTNRAVEIAAQKTTQRQQPTENLTVSLINKINHGFDWFGAHIIRLKTFVSNLVENTKSPGIRLFFVFLLGILMSLTPCIYPMIPVTLGILQTTASTSLARNFSLALSYSVGIASTFATLGLLAASGSAHFGALLGNPYFVMFLILFLGYLAFSMLGFYDMYTPRFLQGGDQGSVNGSFASAFIFGAISGSVASPCLSPGLLLLLSIVATLGSKLLGFVYLFIFGLGLSVPLLIIGTFSNSMNVMPRAGLWMVEVKKFFGFMLLAMCFYYLNNILPWHTLLWMAGVTIACSGLLYLSTIEKYYSKAMKWFKQITGSALLLAGCLIFFQAYKATTAQEPILELSHWSFDYNQAREQAQQEHKVMLVDFGAAWCSSCKEIEHHILHSKQVQEELNSIVMVKVDCTNPHAEHCSWIQEKYEIIGFPTILLIAPETETILARWGGELLDYSPEEFIELVNQTIN